MLQALHDRVTGWIAWLIVGVIALVFGLWGIDSYLQRDAQVYAALVNDVEISVPEYRFAKQQQIQRARNMLGEQYDATLPSTTEFKSAVLNRIVEEELLVQAANAQGMAVSDALLAARIHSIPDFQQDGEFSQDRYMQMLSQQGMTPQRFETQLRRSLLINQLVSGISGSAAVAPQDVDRGLRLQGQERKLRYVRIPIGPYLAKASVTPDELTTFYGANKTKLVEPEQVRLQYLELSLDVIAADLKATEEEIKQLYASEKGRLTTEEQRQARHILIKVEQDAAEGIVASAQSKAEDLVRRLRAGEDFAALAKQYSEDPGSAAEGGDLGLFGKGMMAEEFETATFALEVNAISDPVRSPFGFHIIQVTDIQPAKVPSLDEVRAQLTEEVVRRQAEQLFFERADTLGNLTFEHPDTLSLAAEELGLKIQESGWLPAAGGEGIGAYPKVMEAAFADDVLTGGNNSGVIEVEPNHVFVVRVLEHKPAMQLPLETVRSSLEANLKQQAARKAAIEEGSAWVEKLNAGSTLEKAAEELKLEIQDAGFISRGDSKQDPQIVAEAFRVPRAEADQMAYAGASLANGDYVLMQIEAVREGDVAGFDEAGRTAFRRNLSQLYGSLETAAYIEQLKAKAEIKMDVERLD